MELSFVECLKGFLLGIIQGLTEFLPVSSSGHLVLFQSILGYEPGNGVLTEALLHLGTLISICIVFRKDILAMIKGFFSLIAGLFKGKGLKTLDTEPPQRMVFFILLSLFPLFLALPYKDRIETLFDKPLVVGFALIATGILLFLADRVKKGNKDVMTATPADILVVGLSQVLALTPGLSRSGTTITTGLFRGFDRSFAVRFSFLMSLPAVLGSAILAIKDALEVGIDTASLLPDLIGMAAAAVAGLFAIRLVAWLVKKDKFGGFAYYCAAVGIVVIVLNLI